MDHLSVACLVFYRVNCWNELCLETSLHMFLYTGGS